MRSELPTHIRQCGIRSGAGDQVDTGHTLNQYHYFTESAAGRAGIVFGRFMMPRALLPRSPFLLLRLLAAHLTLSTKRRRSHTYNSSL